MSEIDNITIPKYEIICLQMIYNLGRMEYFLLTSKFVRLSNYQTSNLTCRVNKR